jgi:predicted nucleic acid-binding protein
MRAALADTGPLYAAVDPHDARHKQAIRELSKLDDEKHQVVLAYPTLLEAYTMVLYRLGKNVASTWLDEIGQTAMMNPTPEDYRDAFARARALGDLHITLFDATVAALAIRPFGWVWRSGPTILTSMGCGCQCGANRSDRGVLLATPRDALGTGRMSALRCSMVRHQYYRICPVPMISYLDEVNSASANGPRQWSF